jgi:hypothetical protein
VYAETKPLRFTRCILIDPTRWQTRKLSEYDAGSPGPFLTYDPTPRPHFLSMKITIGRPKSSPIVFDQHQQVQQVLQVYDLMTNFYPVPIVVPHSTGFFIFLGLPIAVIGSIFFFPCVLVSFLLSLLLHHMVLNTIAFRG